MSLVNRKRWRGRQMVEFRMMQLLLCFLLLPLTNGAQPGFICPGFLCDSGQCVRGSAFCDGNCDCNDCSDEKRANCPFHDNPAEGGGQSSGLGSSSIVGIVVAAICILLLIIAILIVFLICRVRREAQKNLRARRGQCIDPSLMATGCALPVNIPIEALAREPPPQYTPMAENATISTSLPLNQYNISVLPPPPPYYRAAAAGPGTSPPIEMDATFENPPKYQSLNNLGLISKTDAEKATTDTRRTSVDTFEDAPSMSNILLTSSRSSRVGYQGGDNIRLMLNRAELSDSARGESLEFDTRSQTGSSATSNSSRLSLGARSRSMSNILSGAVDIPQCGLQKCVNASSSQNARRVQPGVPSRSVPSLVLSDDVRTGRGDAMHKEGGESQSKTDGKQNQRKYRKKADNRAATEMNEDDSREHLPKQFCSHSERSFENGSGEWGEGGGGGGRFLKSKRQISRSLPQLVTLHEDGRWEEIGSCEV